MDALTRLHRGTTGLLARVDGCLTRWGAPEGHPVWPLLRRTGALPGDAVAGLAGWSVQPWLEQRDSLRLQLAEAQVIGERLARVPAWDGRAGDAFAAARDRVSREFGHWADRLHAEAVFHQELAATLGEGKARVARALGRVAGSAEAVVLLIGEGPVPGDTAPGGVAVGVPGADPVGQARAAAAIGEVLLREVDAALTALDGLLARGPELPQTEKVVAADLTSTATTLRVEL
ncbi:hypothetical protein [Catellatospora vulcania]|uniref:hypothetical protein n=1 Tax=Catellatospora vulcania TaxID=1460450 RepID=UPI0012D3E5D2|nr:hypothetical protein [Catellatospora vulcania]